MLQETLDFEERMSATLRRERDDAVSNAKRWETDVNVIRADLRKSQKHFDRLTERYTDLQNRIQEKYPDFPIWSRRNPEPPGI